MRPGGYVALAVLLAATLVAVEVCRPRAADGAAPAAPPQSPPGYTCDAAHETEECVHVIHTYQQNESENFRVLETCVALHRADGSVYAYDWAAARLQRETVNVH